jgi:hypothetical protein
VVNVRDAEWIKASASDQSGSCVEVRRLADGSRQVRDTKDQGEGPILTFTRAEWEAFLEGARTGEFD